ncbi:MAG: glycoside hydrolase family 27 protein [Clostridia bacterium]|nr:glycoside hydrolase family 27 protein [Clostridia bacterium]
MAIAAKPPLGWNSWNTFSHAIDENLIKEAADAMVESGLKDAGYEYIVIDDCWSLRQRDENGRLAPDPEKFPGGMKALADYIHSKGLKFGMYSCVGTRTCADYPGSFGHEFIDAETFAEWGVDYLKYDYCNKPKHVDGPTLYRRMAMALRTCGRDILFAACNWGHDNTLDWIRACGAQTYRSGSDITDSWQSIKDIAVSQMPLEHYAAPYCFNDLDMLVVGMYGKSHNSTIAVNGGCTTEEYKTHFSLWAMMNSPLMIGCDIRNMTDETKAILMNRDILAINQEAECRTPYFSKEWDDVPETVIRMFKPLQNGDYALGFFNMYDDTCSGSAQFVDMGLPETGYGLQLFDLWEQKDLGVFTDIYRVTLPAHGCQMLRAKIVKL